MPCSESVRPLEPMRNRPPHDPHYLEDTPAEVSRQTGPNPQVVADQASTEDAIVLAEPPPAHKLSSVELVPRPEPTFRPVRAVSMLARNCICPGTPAADARPCTPRCA